MKNLALRLKNITRILVVTAIFACISTQSSFAYKLSSEAEISVITCGIKAQVHSVYGHSAVRVKDSAYNYDVVFNYGIFNFNAPNFIYRFAVGQTDYMLGAYKFKDFYESYKEEKRNIFEQVLNLTPHEKQKLFDFLIWNARPENRVYRYNFFFDNCSSKIRDIIQEQLDDELIFPDKNENPKSFRQLIKDYHGNMYWLNFGIDIAVSAPADNQVSIFDEMFLPDYLRKHLGNSKIKTGDQSKPLVKSSEMIYDTPPHQIQGNKLTSPFVVFSILFLLIAFISLKGIQKGKLKNWPDYIIYGITGFLGIGIFYLVLYSEHPAMRPNFNLMWAIPLNFVFAIVWTIKKWRPITKYYHVLVSVWLLIFIGISSFLPQEFHIVFYLIILIMLCRSTMHSWLILKEKKTY